jgi:hypothetical protein
MKFIPLGMWWVSFSWCVQSAHSVCLDAAELVQDKFLDADLTGWGLQRVLLALPIGVGQYLHFGFCYTAKMQTRTLVSGDGSAGGVSSIHVALHVRGKWRNPLWWGVRSW